MLQQPRGILADLQTELRSFRFSLDSHTSSPLNYETSGADLITFLNGCVNLEDLHLTVCHFRFGRYVAELAKHILTDLRCNNLRRLELVCFFASIPELAAFVTHSADSLRSLHMLFGRHLTSVYAWAFLLKQLRDTALLFCSE